MKRISYLICCMIIGALTASLMAQQKPFMHHISVEGGGGYITPISTNRDDIPRSNFAGIRNFYLGANYELSELTGLRFTYSNNNFQDKDDSAMGVTHHKLMAEGTFNIIQWIETVQIPFEVVAHAGAGISLGRSKPSSGIDKMGTLQVGLMPLFRLTHNISIHADAVYVINLRQNYFYDGRPINVGGKQEVGEYFVLNVGVGVRF